MSFTSNPITPTAGVAFTAKNPAAGSGNLSSQAVIVKNVSPYLLSVADGSGSTVGLVDPYTTDLVPLEPNAGQSIEVTPTDLGLLPPGSVPPVIYLTWYSAAETVPGNYPFALPLTTIINDSTTPIPVVTVGGMAYVSLTGAGETATPGDLVQVGGFIVNDVDGDGISLLQEFNGLVLNSGGNSYLYSDLSLNIGPSPSNPNASPTVQISASDQIIINAGGQIDIDGVLFIAGGGGDTVIRVGTNLLGFFDTAPVGPQVSGAALAGVINGLVALGLFSS